MIVYTSAGTTAFTIDEMPAWLAVGATEIRKFRETLNPQSQVSRAMQFANLQDSLPHAPTI